MHYYLTPSGKPGAVTGSGGLALVPTGYREVTEAEYNAAATTIAVPPPDKPPVEADAAPTVPAQARRAKAR
ncbi:hypothetical protein OG896_24515 [Streptomyces sp. NBC_00669]|uniref:hypothetical protein n=1 Tax=Streptomyces sp. NBC_00669 TaxID=2976011 RepID=UPI002E31EDDC|nr:hypothetical protein [Streptomyces sp. NBC_00669]